MQERVLSMISGRTDVGVVRSNNEDNFLIADLAQGISLPENSQLLKSLSENLLLLVVSDGMGGASYGEVASELAVLTIKDSLVRIGHNHLPQDRLVAAVEEANQLIWNESQRNAHMRGMGATVTAAMIEGNRAFVAEVGDSRAYLIRDGRIKQITSDQSLVSHLVSRGVISEEEAATYPRRNVVLQALGVNEVIKVAVDVVDLCQNDRLLLCSDGLYSLFSADELLYYGTMQNVGEACELMIRLARERGAPDNVTVILAEFRGDGLQVSPGRRMLTESLHRLAAYDPDLPVEKSHKRTQLLGETGITYRYYSGPNVRLRVTDNLSAFPQSSDVVSELRKLKEKLVECRVCLQNKIETVEQATTWLASQGIHFTDRITVLELIGEGLKHFEVLSSVVEQLRERFENGLDDS
ncbi:MAG: protein phosphatase 2C domain-containing protein [Acidobacteriota bacterium]|nr:protein phosphatase 2C domain-containing protein [Blastocatellia bacterium]MDW8413307.1 protein phosphatase 2C domain-containing protein [Acidobacteriota bacterium]